MAGSWWLRGEAQGTHRLPLHWQRRAIGTVCQPEAIPLSGPSWQPPAGLWERVSCPCIYLCDMIWLQLRGLGVQPHPPGQLCIGTRAQVAVGKPVWAHRTSRQLTSCELRAIIPTTPCPEILNSGALATSVLLPRGCTGLSSALPPPGRMSRSTCAKIHTYTSLQRNNTRVPGRLSGLRV